jgi:NitT/TauT family transport system substrate-binding protein
MRAWWWVLVCCASVLLASCRASEPPPAPAAASSAPPSGATAANTPSARPATVEKLNVAYVAPSEWMTIPWIAKDTGIFAKHGFDVNLQLVGGTPRLVQSLIAGDYDYAIVGGTAVLQARVQEADTVILAMSGSYFPFKLMAHPDAGAQSVADLRGKTIAVSQVGSTSHAFLRVLLNRAGVPLDDVTILQAGSNPQAATALLTGNIAAATVSGIMVPTVTRAGGIMLADGKALRIPEPNAVVATTRRRVDRDPASTKRFLEAYVEGVHFFKTQREASIGIMQQYMSGLAYDETAYLYDDVKDDYQPLPLPSVEGIQAGLERDIDAPAGVFKPSDFYDSSFLEEIERSGFRAALYR